MSHLRVLLEIGQKRRVVAAATDWPGLDRAAATEEAALEKLLAYHPRYAAVAARAGMAGDFAAAADIEVIERTPGSSSTDFWGIAHVPSLFEFQPVTDAELERRLTLLQAAWAWFDETGERVSTELRPGSRGGGRSRVEIVRHVAGSENHVMSPKVGVRTDLGVLFTPAGLAEHRRNVLEAIRASHADGRHARRWPLPFLVRRMGQHLLDHGWELEDRDLTPR